MQLFFNIFLAILTSFSFLIFGSDTQLIKDKMMQEVDILKNTFEVKYAPAEWKKQFTKWSLEEQAQIAKDKIQNSPNITKAEFRNILKAFFHSTKDYHVGIHFYSTEASFLPFRVQGSKDRYFITWLDRKYVPANWSVGDEVVSFDSIPIKKLIENIKKMELGNPDSQTDQALAEIFLTRRLGILGHEIPQGPVQITLKHLNGSTATYPYKWSYFKENVQPGPYKALSLISPQSSYFPSNCNCNFFKREMVAASYRPFLEAFQRSYPCSEDREDALLLGSKNGFMPHLGQVIWQNSSKNNFQAYLYKNSKDKIIGYVRIPDYLGYSVGIDELSQILKFFEEKSDALVIDETNNPGGELLYMYSVASLLASKPLTVPKHRLTLTQEDAYGALLTIDELTNTQIGQNDLTEILGFPVTPEFLQGIVDFSHFILKEWNEGNYLTAPEYMLGISTLKAHPKACYTKPVLVLVNSLSISCADFLPAILQDNKRAKIFGTTTSGAGGFLIEHGHFNRFGIARYTFTGSIAEREDKRIIENLGVTPDITYQVTVEDLQSNFTGYVKAVNKAVDSLLK